MSYRQIALTENEFYHVYNRGTDKRTIFLDVSDYERFLHLLYLSNTTQAINVRDIRRVVDSTYEYERINQLVSIGAYCLMPNHFHILATPIIENGITLFMQKISTSYAMYFNKKYERNGSLFQGKFKAKHADGDEYLKYLFSYVHLNPTKLFYADKDIDDNNIEYREAKHLFSKVTTYEYSSLPDYLKTNTRPERKILSTESFPKYFSENTDLERELYEWLNFPNLP